MLALVPAFARAQVSATPVPLSDKDTVKLEALTVTGSLIKRLEIEKVLPVTVFNQEAIEIRNAATPVEMLTAMPQVTSC